MELSHLQRADLDAFQHSILRNIHPSKLALLIGPGSFFFKLMVLVFIFFPQSPTLPPLSLLSIRLDLIPHEYE